MINAPTMTLEEKISQLFVLRVHGATANTTDADAVARNQTAYGVDNAAALVSTYQPGGIIYYGDSGNIDNPVQIAELSNEIQHAALDRPKPDPIPVLITADQEGGRVARMSPPATWLPPARTVAAAGVDTAETAATIMARELRSMGIRQNYAPVANVNPDNPAVGDRAFDSRPEAVTTFVRAQVRGFQRGGVAATAKHFPEHGGTTVDTHVGEALITHSRQEWEQLDLPPFQAAVEADVDAVMTGHVIFPALDPAHSIATTSYPIITGLLRQELGFDGVVVADSLDKPAARLAHDDVQAPLRALQAGVDQLLSPPGDTFPAAVKVIKRAVQDGELSPARIDESVDRILRLKRRIGLFDQPIVDVELAAHTVGAREHQRLARRLTSTSS